MKKIILIALLIIITVASIIVFNNYNIPDDSLPRGYSFEDGGYKVETTTTKKKKAKRNQDKTTTTKEKTVKKNKNKTTGIKEDIIVTDRFTSINQMIEKAKTYKTLDDIYESSGYPKNGHYYLRFSEERLTAILEDRIIIVPKGSADYEFLEGGLSAPGYYYFSFRYPKGSFELFVDTYKDSSNLKKGQKPVFNINGTDVYEDVGYFWFYNGFCINVRPLYKLSENELAEMIDNLNFTTITIWC